MKTFPVLIGVVVAIVVATLVIMNKPANAAVELKPGVTTMQCTDFGGKIINYSGSRSNFKWYAEYNYVEIRTSTHTVTYPMGMCIMAEPK